MIRKKCDTQPLRRWGVLRALSEWRDMLVGAYTSGRITHPIQGRMVKVPREVKEPFS